MKRTIAILTAVAMLCPVFSKLAAAYPPPEPGPDSTDSCCYAGGNCYQQCRTAPCVAPAVALGAIALAAIIAVALTRASNTHGHSH